MRAPLEVFFHPRNVAVIGATEELASVGRSLVSNLKQTSFGGRIYPVNPKHSTVLELPCFASIGEVPEKVDLAVIATPASTVPGVVRDCVAAGVQGAIVISAGFKETGEAAPPWSRKSFRRRAREECALSAPTASAS